MKEGCFWLTWWITAHACSSEMGAVKLARICCKERQPPGSKLQPAHPPGFTAVLPNIFLGHGNPPGWNAQDRLFNHSFCSKAVTSDSHWNLPVTEASFQLRPRRRLATDWHQPVRRGRALTVMQGVRFQA